MVALAALGFCFSGVVMASHFTISNPENADHWERVALIYLALSGLALIVFVATVAILIRDRLTRRRMVDAPPLVDDEV